MEMTGIGIYNKVPFQPLHVTYIKPEPTTFDNILKLESLSEEIVVGARFIRLRRTDKSGFDKSNPYHRDSVPQAQGKLASLIEQMRMYKEDQLLSSPGGDSVFVDANGKVTNKGVEHTGFTERVGKDIKDAKSNFVNMLKDASCGAKFSYVTQDGKIEDGQRVGLVKTLENFFKDLFCGISPGTYTPRTEEKPSCAGEAVKHSLKKVFVDAIYKDVVVGIPRGAVQIVKDVALVCLNLAETIPDTTIGNTKTGETVTTKVFDNTQVALNFFTDILPGGEGRGRVYAFKLNKGIKGLPLIHNLTTPEQGTDEADFQHIRNTSFRKTIETISSIIPLGTTL